MDIPSAFFIKTLYKDYPETTKSVFYCTNTESSNLKSLATSNYGSDVDIINEDGELATAYQAQKGINRQLQEELLEEKKFYSEHISQTKLEIDRLREENEKYQNFSFRRLRQMSLATTRRIWSKFDKSGYRLKTFFYSVNLFVNFPFTIFNLLSI